jgi:glutaredoxin
MSNERKQHTITLYTKEGCHLCEDAKAALLSLGNEFEVLLEEVDITTDPAAFELYKYTIPVMIVDQQIKLEARIDRQKLRRALGEGYGPKM